jgi:hypothetical protein
MNHIRLVVSLGGRRINDSIGKTRTLCGGEMTDRDLTWSAAKRSARVGDLATWLACPECRAAVTKSDD